MEDNGKCRIIIRSRVTEIGVADLLARAGGRPVLMDLGTGDGKYPYRNAKADPGLFCIGVDPSEESMREVSGKIGRKPARGGVDNLALVISSLEALPGGFENSADRVTVNFPWGSLLKGASAPEGGCVKKICELLKSGGRLDMLFNMQVFEDEALRERLGLPAFDETHVNEALVPAFAKHSAKITEVKMLAPGELPEHTSWGRQLSVGSGRRSMLVSGRKEKGTKSLKP